MHALPPVAHVKVKGREGGGESDIDMEKLDSRKKIST